MAAAFLITEIVEFAMLRQPGDTVEISLRRTSELTATLAISASVLVPDGDQDDSPRSSSSGSSRGWPGNCARRSSASSGAMPLPCRSFPDELDATRQKCDEPLNNFLRWRGTGTEKKAF